MLASHHDCNCVHASRHMQAAALRSSCNSQMFASSVLSQLDANAAIAAHHKNVIQNLFAAS